MATDSFLTKQSMSNRFVEELELKWTWDAGDPEDIFVLEEEIAEGSFGHVYKVITYPCGKSVKVFKYHYMDLPVHCSFNGTELVNVLTPFL